MHGYISTYEYINTLNLAADLAVFPLWLWLYQRAVPREGRARVIGVVGMLMLMAGFYMLSPLAFFRWQASHDFAAISPYFDVWRLWPQALPLGLEEKLGTLALLVGGLLTFLARRIAFQPRATHDGSNDRADLIA